METDVKTMPPKQRPVIKLKLTQLDIVLEVVGVALLIVMWGFVLCYDPTLPEKIPTHFGPDGKPDAFGPKSMLLILAITGTVIYLPMLVAARFPHWANYPVKVTEENAARLYRYCASLLRELGMGCNVTFLWLVAATCRIATNQANGLGSLFLPCVLVMFLAPTIYYLVRMVMAR